MIPYSIKIAPAHLLRLHQMRYRLAISLDVTIRAPLFHCNLRSYSTLLACGPSLRSTQGADAIQPLACDFSSKKVASARKEICGRNTPYLTEGSGPACRARSGQPNVVDIMIASSCCRARSSRPTGIPPPALASCLLITLPGNHT